MTAAEGLAEQPDIALYQDQQGAFARSYGAGETALLVRPDGYIGWRGRSWQEAGLSAHIARTFQAAVPAASNSV